MCLDGMVLFCPAMPQDVVEPLIVRPVEQPPAYDAIPRPVIPTPQEFAQEQDLRAHVGPPTQVNFIEEVAGGAGPPDTPYCSLNGSLEEVRKICCKHQTGVRRVFFSVQQRRVRDDESGESSLISNSTATDRCKYTTL